ncbi:hypothetical protein GUITHDRAFT_115146 [Guillardia theta CCMP2712]|uniref:Sucrose phosphatase-like domain-containing protein n=2 Tax=Guillardia theta TaxID=55529 RepID=L1ISM8_GUITC|nr:hypothetical protein GUITHDRAFT_115146 [Guillardia theta CCMP2712]EKX38820.1 hypothetical protein GUITHDRAFT_115146 [Guillardia theta CCMP2712]|eukprot:XP_005825800.1 hypothetical protein GUITHDRAFT_115146 [Guillardia theta CCMP2712]
MAARQDAMAARQDAMAARDHAAGREEEVVGRRSLNLRGGEDTQGPTGIWSSFTRMISKYIEKEEEGGAVTIDKFDEAFPVKRSQPQVRFSLLLDSIPAASKVYVVVEIGGRGGAQGVKVEILLHQDKSKIRQQHWIGEAIFDTDIISYKYKVVLQNGETKVEDFERKCRIYPKAEDSAVFLATDLDGTLLGDDEQIKNFFTVWNDEYKKKGSCLLYNTGRPFHSALDLIHRDVLQRPTALICSEGTEIFWFDGDNHTAVPDAQWRKKLNELWNWPKLRDAVNVTLAPLRSNITKFLPLADDNGQPMFVLAANSRNVSEKILSLLDTSLRRRMGLKFDAIQSSSGYEWYVLLVPPGVSKGSATLHCSAILGFNKTNMMVSGDGENDVPLFEITRDGVHGALVANAAEGLVRWRNSENLEKVILATRKHAGGIIEGLKHHFAKFGYTHKSLLNKTSANVADVMGNFSHHNMTDNTTMGINPVEEETGEEE